MCPMQLTDVRKDFARVNFTHPTEAHYVFLVSFASDFFAESDGSFRMVREYSLSAFVLFARKQLETCHPLKFNFHY